MLLKVFLPNSHILHPPHLPSLPCRQPGPGLVCLHLCLHLPCFAPKEKLAEEAEDTGAGGIQVYMGTP